LWAIRLVRAVSVDRYELLIAVSLFITGIIALLSILPRSKDKSVSEFSEEARQRKIQEGKEKMKFREYFDLRVQEIRKLSFEELEELLQVERVENIEVSGHRGQIVVFVEASLIEEWPPERLKVFIVRYLDGEFLNHAGFHKNRDGSVEPMEREELYGHDHMDDYYM